MSLPDILIKFQSEGTTAIQRGERGIIALILREENLGIYEIRSMADIPEDLSVENSNHVKRALIGGITPPKKIILIGINSEGTYIEALKKLETFKFDYVVGDPQITEEETETLVLWIKTQRDTVGKKVKAVVANKNADHEGIINFTTTGIKTNDKTFTTKEYCSRIAGLIAGTPLEISCTFAVLPEVIDIDRLTQDEVSEAINKGEFVIFHDGEKVKVGRGVNSLVTTTVKKGESFKKIKIVDIADLIYTDIRKTAHDSFIGKYPNNYDNKCILIAAIKGYYESLGENLLEANHTLDIDIEKNRIYLNSRGIDTDTMTEYELKSANTGEKAYFTSKIKILDAIEDIEMDITI